MVDAARFMKDAKNADTVADAPRRPAPEGRQQAALKEFLAIDFWPADADGLDRTKLEATIALMKKIGGIQPRQGGHLLRQAGGPSRLARRCGAAEEVACGATPKRWWTPTPRCIRRGQANPNVLDSLRKERAGVAEPARRRGAVGDRRAQLNAAFLVPLSETLVRLWQLVGTGVRGAVLRLGDPVRDRRRLGIVVGMPLGLLLAGCGSSASPPIPTS
jgi:hypothetical protein